MRRALATASAGLLLAGLVPLAFGSSSTGLHGYLRKTPTGGPCRTESCEAPARGVTLTFAASDGTRVSVKTNLNGFYRVVLGPGSFTVRTNARSDRIPTPERVRTRLGRDGRIDFLIESGLE